MYIKEGSQQIFEIPKNNFDERFERLTETTAMKYYTPQTRNENKIHVNPQFMMVQFQNNSDAQKAFRQIPGLFSCAVISASDKIF